MATAALFIKKVSEHFFKLGHQRQFFDVEHLFTNAELLVLWDLQKKYGKMGELLANMYEYRNAGITDPKVFWDSFPELRRWLDEVKFDVQQREQATEAGSSSESLTPLPALSNTKQQESSTGEKSVPTPPTSVSQTESL